MAVVRNARTSNGRYGSSSPERTRMHHSAVSCCWKRWNKFEKKDACTAACECTCYSQWSWATFVESVITMTNVTRRTHHVTDEKTIEQDTWPHTHTHTVAMVTRISSTRQWSRDHRGQTTMRRETFDLQWQRQTTTLSTVYYCYYRRAVHDADRPARRDASCTSYSGRRSVWSTSDHRRSKSTIFVTVDEPTWRNFSKFRVLRESSTGSISYFCIDTGIKRCFYRLIYIYEILVVAGFCGRHRHRPTTNTALA